MKRHLLRISLLVNVLLLATAIVFIVLFCTTSKSLSTGNSMLDRFSLLPNCETIEEAINILGNNYLDPMNGVPQADSTTYQWYNFNGRDSYIDFDNDHVRYVDNDEIVTESNHSIIITIQFNADTRVIENYQYSERDENRTFT